MKKILGLDLGTNSIGWAVVEIDDEKRIVRIIALGSRILPMDAGEISVFENGGKLKSSASDRTDMKSKRKNIYRFILRRDRLHCVLNLLDILPEHYKLDIEFTNNKGKRSGKIKSGKEPKLAYYIDEKGNNQFLFMDSYNEMEKEFKSLHQCMFYKKKNGKETKLPYDWTLYYLRKKALSQAITDEELAWVIMSFLQKRGYEKVIGQDEKEQKNGELSEIINAKVESIEELKTTSDDGLKKYRIKLVDSFGNIVFTYDEEASYQISEINEFKQIEKISKLDNDGNIKSVEISISEIKNLEIVNIVNTHEREKDKTKFILQLSSGWEQKYLSQYEPKHKGTKKDFIIKNIYDQNGKLKKRNIGMPKEEDWELEKLKTETSIQDYNTKHNTIGVASYIYDSILKNPNQKIKAGLVTTIERRFYEEELKAILESQKKYHSYLKDEQKYRDALLLLYPNNETHRNTLAKQNFSSLLADDIIMYQRDLKTKKSLIANCKYEYREYIKDGKTIKEPLKCVPKSNPFYQEFRLWQFIKRLRIIQLECKNNGNENLVLVNQDVTEQLLTNSVKESLFSFLNDRKDVSQDAILKKIGLNKSEYKWNFEDDHIEPCNETRYDFILRLKRIKKFDYEKFLCAKSKVRQSKETDNTVECCTNEYQLWHFFYSVKKREERIKGLPKLIEKLLANAGMESTWKNSIVEMLSTISTYKNDYGTYSEKAIKKLLPFMRLGKYWNKEDIERIKTVDVIKPEILTKENINGEITDLQGLWLSSACYIVYGRYAEVGDAKKWTQPYDIIKYLKNDFRHNSLNNPVVEKVVRETLMVVHDIWTTFGEIDRTYHNDDNEEVQKYKKYFDKIHIEIGTELKKNNQAKENASKRNKKNRLSNDRAIAMLKELKYTYKNIDIRENSPFQQEKFRILESDIIDSIKYDKDDTKYGWKNSNTTEKEFTKKEIKDLLKKEVSKISAKDIERYRLWLDQRYLSPYTGKPIKLSDLLDRNKYQIEHIFPQERVTLNSLNNKVICETIVNKAKGAMTGYEFILKSNGKTTYNGIEIQLLTPDEYVLHIKNFIANEDKQEILLSKDIPNKFGNNQMNNTRYIEKLAMGLLSNIVREDDENEYKSKNVLVISGAVTKTLKRDWQLDDAWNEIIKPRFIRLNNLLETNDYTEVREIDGHTVCVPTIPDKDIDKKRIDHRHHALDALIIALATNNHVNYINNISALDINTDRKNERRDLKAKYMNTVKHDDSTKNQHFLPPMQYKENGNIVSYKYTYKQSEPESIFKNVAAEALQNTLVTFKQKNRIMRQRINWIQIPNNKDNSKESELNQKRKYSVRQSLHKETYYGKRQIRPIAIEDAINNPENIIENKIKHIIQQYKQEGKTKDEIVKELKKIISVVYVKEECATTQWSHSLINHFANITEDEKDKKTIKTGKSAIIREIECIADITIQKILKKHLAKYRSIKMMVSEASKYINDIVDEKQKEIVHKYIETGENGNETVDVFVGNKETKDRQISENPQIAFSPDGINAMNDNIVELNNGKNHKPIYKVQMIQALGKMFPVSEKEKNRPETVKNKQFVISNAGSNNFCGIYKTSEGETKTFVPALKTTIESIRNDAELFPKNIREKDKLFELKFIISPLDLVYMPTEDEIINNNIGTCIDYDRIFVVNDFNDGVTYFRPNRFANAIHEKEVDLKEKNNKGKNPGSFSDKTASFEGRSIRDFCLPIKVDRLGNIIEINGKHIK